MSIRIAPVVNVGIRLGPSGVTIVICTMLIQDLLSCNKKVLCFLLIVNYHLILDTEFPIF